MIGESTVEVANGQANCWGYRAWVMTGVDPNGGINIWDVPISTGRPAFGILNSWGQAGSMHPSGCQFAMCDGSVRFVSQTVSSIVLWTMAKRPRWIRESRRVEESKSRRVKESKSQRVEESKSRRVEESKSRRVMASFGCGDFIRFLLYSPSASTFDFLTFDPPFTNIAMKPKSSRVSPTICLILAMLSFSTLASCGSSDSDLKPATGEVKYKGQPLAGATIRFVPAGTTGGFGGSGKTDANGNYEITYVRGGKGLLPGEYRVTVSKRVMPDGSAPPENVEPIDSPAGETLPRHYSDEAATQLTKTVLAEGGTINFDLE